MDAIAIEGWPADRTLSLSGAPRRLRLPVTLSNTSDRSVSVAQASLADVRLGEDGPSLREAPVPVGLVVAAGGALSANIPLRLDRATPPGRYTGALSIGGIARPVEIDVAADAALDVRPDPVIIDAALGRTATVSASFENRGNVVLTIDVAGRYRLGEEATLGVSRLPEDGSGGDGSGGMDALRALLQLIPGLARRPALVDVGEASLAMPGGVVTLEPGSAATVEIAVRLPEGLSETARYHLFAPVYAADLHIVVVTAAKAAPKAPRPRRSKGAEA